MTPLKRMAVFYLVCLLIFASCGEADFTPESSSEDAKIREFASSLDLDVWILDSSGDYQRVDTTPVETPISIGGATVWRITPIGDTTVKEPVAEVGKKRMPGLKLRQAGGMRCGMAKGRSVFTVVCAIEGAALCPQFAWIRSLSTELSDVLGVRATWGLRTCDKSLVFSISSAEPEDVGEEPSVSQTSRNDLIGSIVFLVVLPTLAIVVGFFIRKPEIRDAVLIPSALAIGGLGGVLARFDACGGVGNVILAFCIVVPLSLLARRCREWSDRHSRRDNG